MKTTIICDNCTLDYEVSGDTKVYDGMAQPTCTECSNGCLCEKPYGEREKCDYCEYWTCDECRDNPELHPECEKFDRVLLQRP